MADVELVIKITEDSWKATCNGCMLPTDVENVVQGIKNGTPLDDVKAKIEQTAKDYDKFDDYRRVRGLWIALEILNGIGKEESENKYGNNTK